MLKWSVPFVLLVSNVILIHSSKSSKCSKTELAQFSNEYEQCHGRALQKLKTGTTMLAKRFTNPDEMASEKHKMICNALQSLIEDCTVILGWCYTSSEVEVTKEKQKVLLQHALLKMFPDFEVQECLNYETPTAELPMPKSPEPVAVQKASQEPRTSGTSQILPITFVTIIGLTASSVILNA
ncbi:hypothetical protein TCAL_09996, partial [Tigriopus californicus]|eukprot:TCALIF_09996-PA protein Name:"Protein of unknown function" AED:0.01 eAED:0.01 QI:111/1/0.66/1/0.5/0.33/3/0/181